MVKEIVQKALNHINHSDRVKQIQRVAGGSINKSFYIETKEQQFFMKYHESAPKHFFAREVDGLSLLRNTNTVQVPEVFTFEDGEDTSYILMEWLEGKETKDTDIELGTKLAALHLNYGKKHGFPETSFIGIMPQRNGLYADWLTYYRDIRLESQLYYGIKVGAITTERWNRLERLFSRLDEWIPKDAKPSFLHGDLWAGNWITGPKGKPYLIDPSFLYGDRHFELAFTELFGGFSNAFYEAYQAYYPLEPYFNEVKDLYKLYYLLAHLNMFGEAYGVEVDAILDKYIT